VGDRHARTDRELATTNPSTPGSARRYQAENRERDARRCGSARQHTDGRIRWVLSNGTELSHQAAFDVRSDPHVIPVGDCLFGAELSQTFQYVSKERGS
jgi:hypothetical protein